MGGVGREIDRGNYQSGQGTPGKLWKEGYGGGSIAISADGTYSQLRNKSEWAHVLMHLVYFHILAR